MKGGGAKTTQYFYGGAGGIKGLQHRNTSMVGKEGWGGGPKATQYFYGGAGGMGGAKASQYFYGGAGVMGGGGLKHRKTYMVEQEG